jgi:hypothetical protein
MGTILVLFPYNLKFFFMKQFRNTLAKAALVIAGIFMSLVCLAQEKSADIKVDIDTDKGGSTWYGQPWVWVVGAAVFILLLVALLKNNRARE